jgi:N-acetyl sugar amidotransferase
MPSTKPYITFDEQGVCSACRASDKKQDGIKGINWNAQEEQFAELVHWAKAQNAELYDAVVPVSGGKDSITQVHRLLKYGVRILAVNIDYGIKTDIGRYNLDLIPKMGASLITFRPEQKLHVKLIRIGLEDFGDPDLLSHTLLHAYPLRVAVKFKVPLFLHGENSAFEYGGDQKVAENFYFNRAWFNNYAANGGKDARFISEKYDIPFDLLRQYDFPDELDPEVTKAVFSSHFFNWDSEEHLVIARKYGFKSLDEPREGTYRTYVGIDEKINRLHQYLKVLKFGYGRATDHACEDLRNGRLSREEARKLVKEYDLQPLGKDYIEDICAYLGYSEQEFTELLEQFRNTDIWKKNSNGEWYIPGHLED